jgi:hypothetical protein
MSVLEFQRELSPGQIDEALSLLDNAGRATNRNLQVEDSRPAQRDYLRADQEDRLAAPEGPRRRKKHLHLALACCGLAIAVAATLTLFSRSDVLTRPPPPAIAREQNPNRPAAQLAKSASPSVPVTNPTPDPGESAPPALKSAVADPSPVGQTNRETQAVVTGAANSPSATPNAAWRDQHGSRKPKEARRHRRAIRVAAAKRRFWRGHRQPRVVEIYSAGCFFFTCLPPVYQLVR